MNQKTSLPEKSDAPQSVFHGVRFDVYSLNLLGKQGKPFRWEYVVHPGAVVILPLLDENTVVMIRNERIAVKQTLWELPAGTLEKNETPPQTAARELVEETGYASSKITPLTEFYTSPGISNEIMYTFLAKDLQPSEQHLDDSEKIIVEPLSWNAILKMMKSGIIKDGKTLAALLYYRQLFM